MEPRATGAETAAFVLVAGGLLFVFQFRLGVSLIAGLLAYTLLALAFRLIQRGRAPHAVRGGGAHPRAGARPAAVLGSQLPPPRGPAGRATAAGDSLGVVPRARGPAHPRGRGGGPVPGPRAGGRGPGISRGLPASPARSRASPRGGPRGADPAPGRLV